MRTAVAIILVAGLAASLAACSTPGPGPAGDCSPTSSGSASEAVKITGDFGSLPEAEFSAPLTTKGTERTVDIDGDGKDAADTNQVVTVDFVIYNGTTGDQLTASAYDGSETLTVTVNEELFLPGIVKTVKCSTEGTRVVGVIPPEEAFAATGNSDLGIGPEDQLVFVADVISVTDGAAWGKSQDPVDGLPTVTLDDSGHPSITIPDAEPPADLKIATLKEGDGDVVKDGDIVLVQYTGVVWATGTTFDESWGKSGAVAFSTSGVVPGFSQALVGQTVGSQVLAVIPPELGYGPSGGSSDGQISATDTIVFVVDILNTTTPAAK